MPRLSVIAHIGNVPVEEWLPFLFPVLALYLYGRHRSRLRREAVERLPDVSVALDEGTVKLVLDRWSNSKHEGLSRAYLPLLYPPGPDGMSAQEIAVRLHEDPATVGRLLEELADLGYLDLEQLDDLDERRVCLTFEGYELVHEAEAALLSRAG